jgi:amidase
MTSIFDLDQVNAFCKHAPIEIQSNSMGPLSGLKFAVKDIFDIAGVPTSFGSPAWLESHPTPTQTSSFINKLVDAGASLVGKTHTDELTYSILGMNAHYGTPINSAAPDRIPGGSSSGSAAAVAANLVDFAIGSDTGGSVRAPASFCGVYGFRPTHNRIQVDHVRPLAKSFDTLGWFSKDPKLMLKLGEILLGDSTLPSDKPTFYYLKEAFDLLPLEMQIRSKEAITQYLKTNNIKTLSIGNNQLKEWSEIFRIIQGYEIWNEHGEWAQKHTNEIGPGIKERLEMAKRITKTEFEDASAKRIEIANLMTNLLGSNNLLILPTVTDIPPKLSSTPEEFDSFRKSTFQLLCIAGLCGLPQISIPMLQLNEAPFGISLIGSRNSDLRLLGLL